MKRKTVVSIVQNLLTFCQIGSIDLLQKDSKGEFTEILIVKNE